MDDIDLPIIIKADRLAKTVPNLGRYQHPRYMQHNQPSFLSWLKKAILGFLRTLACGKVMRFFHLNRYERSHPTEPRSGRELLAPPNSWQVVRWVLESVTQYGLASVGVFLISYAPVTKQDISEGATEVELAQRAWSVIIEVSFGIVLLIIGVVFLAYPKYWKTRRKLQVKGLELDPEQHVGADERELRVWRQRKKNLEKADKNDLGVTQSLFGVFANAAFAILINRPTLSEWVSLTGGISLSLSAAMLTRWMLARSIERASIQLRLLTLDEKNAKAALEEVSNQHRMYVPVTIGLLAGFASVLASLIQRAVKDRAAAAFLEELVTNTGPSAFNSLAAAGALIYFARTLHEQASHVAIVEADETQIFMEKHDQTATGESKLELQLLAEVSGCVISVYDEEELGVNASRYRPRPRKETKAIRLFKTRDGFRTIEPGFFKFNYRDHDSFYNHLRENFNAAVLGRPNYVPCLTEIKPILKHIWEINKRSFARSSYECIAHETPRLKRERFLCLPTRRKMSAQLRGDVADLRAWLGHPLQHLKPTNDPVIDAFLISMAVSGKPENGLVGQHMLLRPSR